MPTTFTNLRISRSATQNFPVSAWTFGSTDTTASANAAVTVTLNTDGTTTISKEGDDETLIDTTTNWYTPTTGSIGTSYWVQATLNSGNAATSGTFGSRLQLNSARAWNWATTTAIGVKSGQIKFDFYDAAAAGNLVGTVNADFTVTPGSAFSPTTVTYTSGTAATETAPTGATNVIIAVWGGGGGGGAGWFSDTDEQSGGGGAGGYSQSTYSITGGQTLVYTVGPFGAGGGDGAGGTSGTASTISSGTRTITTMTANGGSGGAPNGLSSAPGGTASGGTTTNTTGGAGLSGNAGGTGGTAVSGWNSNTGGAGGAGGFGEIGEGSPGQPGKVIFYYT